MKNHGSVLEYFKWGGKWESVEQVPLMKRNAYTLVRVVFSADQKEFDYYDVMPAFDANVLENDFQKFCRNTECEIERIIVLKRGNDNKLLMRMKGEKTDV